MLKEWVFAGGTDFGSTPHGVRPWVEWYLGQVVIPVVRQIVERLGGEHDCDRALFEGWSCQVTRAGYLQLYPRKTTLLLRQRGGADWAVTFTLCWDECGETWDQRIDVVAPSARGG